MVVVLSLIFLGSAFMVARHYYEASKSASQFQQLAETTTPKQEDAPEREPTPADLYGEAAAQNEDMVGWIRIEGTVIDYPVMQTPDRPNYYLRRGFDKKYSYYGVPYAAENCDVNNSANVVIHGHNMKNGSMFSDLEKYLKRSFYDEHSLIQFDTLERFGTYQIIAVFKATPEQILAFNYAGFADGTEEEFDAYIEYCKELSLYEIEDTAAYGDRLITLSTCEYTTENGRLVIVAKKIA